jgi:hypothetical protein
MQPAVDPVLQQLAVCLCNSTEHSSHARHVSVFTFEAAAGEWRSATSMVSLRLAAQG